MSEIYIGVANKDGIDCILPESIADSAGMTTLSHDNDAKYSVLFRVEMTEDSIDVFNDMMHKKMFKEALMYLKSLPTLQVEKGKCLLWSIIPQ